ncbi:MAG: PBP1A family penicillin-binding protein [Pseudomonadota bacterium]
MSTFRADIVEPLSVRLKQRARALIGAGVLTVLIVLLFTGAVFWRWAFHDMPAMPEDAEALWAVRLERSVTLTDEAGAVLAQRGPLYGPIMRLDALPPYVPQAFIAIEDERFFSHSGVDGRGIIRAVAANLRAGATVQGGSTLTMQLVKNLLLTPERTVRRKIQEIRLARALEQRVTKEEVLELYLNRIYLGEQAFGVEAAANRYFAKSAAELTLAEAALLAALPKAPSRLAPTENLSAAQARAETVLKAMLNAGFIDSIAYLGAISEPASPVTQIYEDPLLYGHVFDHVVTETERLIGARADDPDLVIEITIDRSLQAQAQSALSEGLANDPRAGDGALVALDMDGHIRAMVGGRDYRTSQFNRAVQARRQPGSAFKPVVFAAALEAGLSPSSVFRDQPIDLEGWAPENFSGGFRGVMTIEDALKRSVNTVAAQVGAQIGVDRVSEMARRLGIRSPIAALPAITLGTAEVNLLELTGAYLVFARDGVRRPPTLIRSIRNLRGETLYEAIEPPGSRALTQADARAMSTMLQSVISDGTGRRAQLRRPAAGKTGTSQNSRDAWFVGYTAQLAAGVWVGNDDDSAMDGVTGGSIPAQIWRDFMHNAHEGQPSRPLAAAPPQRRTEREERLAAFYSELSVRFSELGAEPWR